MSILRPRFIGPYGTEDGEHNALYFQREVQDFMKDVLSGVTVEDGRTILRFQALVIADDAFGR